MEKTPERPLSPEHAHSVAVGIILSLVTCGLYNIYWNRREFEAMNELLGREEYRFWYWLGLTIITCGIFHIYYEYKMGGDLLKILRAKGHDPNPNLPILGLVLSCLGLTIVADAVYQHEINALTRPA